MNEMLIGAIASLCFVIGLFFLRYWKTSGDRFFLYFAISFLIESVNRVSLCVFFDLKEASPIYYLIRLIAYSFIIFAIIQKNKKSPRNNTQQNPE
jgi:hypothetical protein